MVAADVPVLPVDLRLPTGQSTGMLERMGDEPEAALAPHLIHKGLRIACQAARILFEAQG